MPTTEGLEMENYHQDLEIKPIIHQPVHSKAELTLPEDSPGPTTSLVLASKGKRDLGPWAGTHIREEGTRRGMPVMKLETKDMVQRMTPDGEMTTRRVGIAERRGPMKTSSSGGPCPRNPQSSLSK